MESIVVDDAACLLLSLSSGSGSDDSEGSPKRTACKRRRRIRPTDGEFECKTCNRRFSSFQALGGHRTGHKRAKILNLKDILNRSDMYIEHRHLQNNLSTASTARKTQLHQCTICGEGFSMGQALGGHMRRHRADPVDNVEVEVASGLNMPLPSLEECGRSGEVFAAVPRKNTSHIRLLELFV